MYNLLVVDDERFAADTIAHGIEWAKIGISEVFVAYCALDAMELYEKKQIDVMICDIEMPGNNGIQLLKWVKENYPYTETVFLTGHADFNYAQQAVQLGSFDYLLKPVDYDRLKEIITRALEEVENRRKTDGFYKAYQEYASVWKLQIPVLVERFWQDVFSERLTLSDLSLNRMLELYNIPLTSDSLIVPILMNAEQWQEPMNSKDEEIMKYAVRNIASEIILESFKGAVIQDHEGNNLALIYSGDEKLDMNEIKALSGNFVHACNSYLKCSISCYIGEPAPIRHLIKDYYILLEIECSNINKINQIVQQRDYTAVTPRIYRIPAAAELELLLETGKKQEILDWLKSNLDGLQEANVSSEALEAFYYSIQSAIYQLFRKKGLSIYDVLGSKDVSNTVFRTRSMAQFREWAFQTINAAVDFLNAKGESSSAVVEKIRDYINAHIYEDISREEIASQVYLNPGYISRLFKKEMGIALFDYIIRMKMEKAKSLLSDTNIKIGDIAEQLNYYQFSHFTKMFKKFVGVSPLEYRKKYQK